MSPPTLRLKDLAFLSHSKCKIKNPDRVEKIINELVEGGPNRLQVVSDFDHTITKQRSTEGNPVATSFEIFSACQSLPSNYIVESTKLFHKYHPLEIDPNLPKKDKIQYMIEWWEKTNDLLIGFPFNENELDEVAHKYKDSLRDRSAELFETLDHLQVPVLVFSAGFGHSVEAVLKQANVYHDKVKIVSNFLQTKDGLLNGFKRPIIHTFNKNETVLDGYDYSLVEKRDNIILMGDSLGDADMANGVPSSSHIIKIGFLFHHPEEYLEKYMDTFDIVLIDDQTMDVPIGLVNLIKSNLQ